jgi:O-antigen ligase
MAISAPLAIASLSRRYEVAPVAGSYEERQAFERAAWMIVEDHPFGIGPNHYVVVANTGGYSERAGVIWNAGSRAAHVHNVYLVILAETGWLGLASYLWMILGAIFVAFRCAFRFRKDPRGDLILGVGMGLVVVSLHALYEWVLVTSFAQNLLFISIGLIAGLARLLGYYSGRKRVITPAAPLESDKDPSLAPAIR